jgi:hypothetical protein
MTPVSGPNLKFTGLTQQILGQLANFWFSPVDSTRRAVARRGGPLDGAVVCLRAGPGRLGAIKRPQRFPIEIHFVWGFCMRAQGA